MARNGSAWLASTFLALLAWPGAAQEQPRFALEGWYWRGDLEASARVSDGAIGTLFDFKQDLGLTDKDVPEGRFVWTIGPHSRLRFAYLDVAYHGDATVTRTIEFSGVTYTVGTRVLTDLEKQYMRVGWVWQFVRSAGGKFRLGTILELKRLKIDATLQAPELAPPVRERDGFDGVQPSLGIAIDVNPHRAVNLFIEGSGIAAGNRGSMVDAEAGVRVFPIANFGLLAAYRVLDLRLDNKPDYAKLRIAGPFVGLSVRW